MSCRSDFQELNGHTAARLFRIMLELDEAASELGRLWAKDFPEYPEQEEKQVAEHLESIKGQLEEQVHIAQSLSEAGHLPLLQKAVQNVSDVEDPHEIHLVYETVREAYEKTLDFALNRYCSCMASK